MTENSPKGLFSCHKYGIITYHILRGLFMKRKYLFEAGLDVYTSFKTILPVEYLKDLENKDDHKYHIYAILAYPQVYFSPQKTYVG